MSDEPTNSSEPSDADKATAPPVTTALAATPPLTTRVIAPAVVTPPDDTRLVRLATPSFGGIVRAVLILAVCAIVLYLTWRVRGVIRLVGISLFLALALFPLVDAIDHAGPVCPGPSSSSSPTWC